ncbi:hypothetical protein [Mycolicibacterium baixiangningiae]|uniref:hypothetical protein n=1 Tax=Mycolicibacterium baixiangningiae TaxID=2761578 RepID=UPI0018D0B369|nr:hypothetical protein [Mycolicibacterium baixiangningiae]
MDKFDKASWIGTVAADDRLSPGERFVLLFAAYKYVRRDEGTLRVRQATIADRCSVSERVVRNALTKAKRLGYIVTAQTRQRGRAHHGPDLHQLTLPVGLPVDRAGNDDGIPVRIDTNTGTDRPEYRHETTGIPVRPDAVNSENPTPIGFLPGSLTGSMCGGGDDRPARNLPAVPDPLPPGPVAVIGDDPEPQRFCDRHMPSGTDEPCGACKGRRRLHETWERCHPYRAHRPPTAFERKAAAAAELMAQFTTEAEAAKLARSGDAIDAQVLGVEYDPELPAAGDDR